MLHFSSFSCYRRFEMNDEIKISHVFYFINRLLNFSVVWEMEHGPCNKWILTFLCVVFDPYFTNSKYLWRLIRVGKEFRKALRKSGFRLRVRWNDHIFFMEKVQLPRKWINILKYKEMCESKLNRSCCLLELLGGSSN